MNTRLFLLLVVSLRASAFVAAQPVVDAPETLRWVKKQGQRIESSLNDAIRSGEQTFMLLQMHRAWREFDAVAQAGLYCHAARVAAERGRSACDLLNLERKKDLSNLVIRATEAREEAFRMAGAAENCLTQLSSSAGAERRYLPSDLLVRDALMVELDLSDAKASGDFHILAQKVEHALRVLRDAEYLSFTLDDCSEVHRACLRAEEACRNALTANQWETAVAYLRRALEEVQIVRTLAERCK